MVHCRAGRDLRAVRADRWILGVLVIRLVKKRSDVDRRGKAGCTRSEALAEDVVRVVRQAILKQVGLRVEDCKGAISGKLCRRCCA